MKRDTPGRNPRAGQLFRTRELQRVHMDRLHPRSFQFVARMRRDIAVWSSGLFLLFFLVFVSFFNIFCLLPLSLSFVVDVDVVVVDGYNIPWSIFVRGYYRLHIPPGPATPPRAFIRSLHFPCSFLTPADV